MIQKRDGLVNRMNMSTVSETVQELRLVLIGERPVADAVIPPLVFVLFNAIDGLTLGLLVAVASAIAITLVRLLRKRSSRFALAGLAGTAAAATLAALSGSATAFFVPGIMSGLLTAVVALISIVAGRPMVAWTSKLVRRWPAAWYRHPQVHPAYREVTGVWAAFFASRAALQWSLASQGNVTALAGVRLIGGWPALIILLVGTYLYGLRRLSNLRGPSVDEFRSGVLPPWSGQQRGF